MKSVVGICLLLICAIARGQVICGSANENAVLTLTAPAGHKFTSIEFASYGTPNGSCNAFTTSGCHAASSTSLVSSAFIGHNSASITASNGVFGDPCVGTVKRLTVQARYDVSLPVTLLSFGANTQTNGRITISWTTTAEANMALYIIERSEDGVFFSDLTKVESKHGASNSYNFTVRDVYTLPKFVRLKMVDQDGSYQYSNIIRLEESSGVRPLQILSEPSNQSLTVLNGAGLQANIYSSQGQLLKKVVLHTARETINIASLPNGIFFLRTSRGTLRFTRR